MADAPGYAALLDDLVAEEAALDAVVAELTGDAWLTATPAVGWDVRDTIAHLAAAEDLASLALGDPAAFGPELTRLVADLDTTGDELTARGRALTGPDVLEWWRTGRDRTVTLLAERQPRDRVPWVSGLMSAMSFATARLMETWAHGVDVHDALGVAWVPTARLRHIADLGVRTRGNAYAVRGRDLPAGDVRVELTGPDGATWTWGESATDAVRGPAADFCLVVTQRRNVAGTALEVVGPLAREWMSIAQAFAGPPTDPRPAA
jgi:uncharacterized protein (TIGR03084 family)